MHILQLHTVYVMLKMKITLQATSLSSPTLTIKWYIIVLLLCFDGVHPSLIDDSGSAEGPSTLVVVDRGLPHGTKGLKQGLFRGRGKGYS